MQISQILAELATAMELEGENRFKVSAIKKGAEILEGVSKPELKDIASGEKKVPGIGDGLRKMINEFLETGEVKEHRDAVSKMPHGVFELTQVPGLGIKKAMVIAEKLGVRTIGELEYACRENRLTTLKGFGEALQTKILKAIEQQKQFAGKLRLDEVVSATPKVEEELLAIFKGAAFAQVGELARRHEIISEVAWVIDLDSKKVAKGIESFDHHGEVQSGQLKFAKATLDSYTVQLSKRHKHLAGLRLTLIAAPDFDEAITKWLTVPAEWRADYLKRRKDFDGFEPTWLEPEWFATHRKPTAKTYRVATHGHVRGFFHCHTSESDGTATLEEMVKAAQKLGHEYIGISDHSQSAHYARGLTVERIRDQRSAIAALQKKFKIRIFHGIESDILADGGLDYEPKVLSEFDFVIASIHSRFQMDESQMTERLLKALANPYTTFLGHPTGRLLLARNAYAFDWNVILKAAVHHGVLIELNANPQRLDVDWRLGATLHNLGASISVNPDAHSIEGIEDTIYGEWMAEKAMVDRDQVFNLRPLKEVEAYLCARKKKIS